MSGRVCESCREELTERKATTSQPYRYILSGLNNVFLAGVTVRICPKCGEESAVIPRMAELHDLIVRRLVETPRLLTGSEARFLRKAAGFPAAEFAVLLRVNPAHLSRFETGKRRHLGPSTDKLLRALAVVGRSAETARDILLRHAQKLRSGRPDTTPPMFRLRPDGWRGAA
jgi:transcriptional regulator with XRE-family HTH domain